MNHSKKGRLDRFALARGSARLASPYVGITIVPHDRINWMIDQRLRGTGEDRPGAARKIEDFLARYFAPGCCRQAG